MKSSVIGQSKPSVIRGRGENTVRSMNPDRRPSRPKLSSARPNHALGYDAFADDLYEKLNPMGPVESLVAQRVVETAWVFKTSVDRQSARADVTANDPDQAQVPTSSRRATTVDRAMRTMKDALDTLDALQARRPVTAFPKIEPASSPILDLDPEPSVVAFDPFFDGDASEWTIPAEVTPEPTEEAPIWKDRLVFDFEVSDDSPVVKGTWVTVNHVVSLIVDGSTWADILRSHPELTEDDVHACMAYALDELNDPK